MCVRSFEGLLFYCKSLGPIAIAAITSLEVMCFLGAIVSSAFKFYR